MATLQVTARQFREKQKSLFELADKGQKAHFSDILIRIFKPNREI